MNQRVKKEWLAALRSGKYKQGKFTLRTSNNKFCCLGVLCDLYLKEKKKDWDISSSGRYAVGDDSGVLPQKVMRWAGLKNPNPVIKDNEVASNINDHGGSSFKKIATLIENNL